MSRGAALQEKVEQYLAERRQVGFAMRTVNNALASFTGYVDEIHHAGPVTNQLAMDWAMQARQGGRPAASRRLSRLRPFLRWLRQFEPETQVPEGPVFGARPRRTAPHIYRDDEIVDLLVAAKKLRPAIRGAVYEALFGLLASAGLRISEALALTDDDVDLKDGVLTVRETKFAKSRLVPLHPSTTKALARYQRIRSTHVQSAPQAPFFMTTRGKRFGLALRDHQVHNVFAQLRTQLGWKNRGEHHAARVHDLRHTMAVRRLVLWYEQGVDLDQHMLALSTYLGHVKISYTYWYLSGVPELVALAGSRFKDIADHLEPGDG